MPRMHWGCFKVNDAAAGSGLQKVPGIGLDPSLSAPSPAKASATHRDPLFALRRSARNLQYADRLARFPELDSRLAIQAKPLYVVFVHGGLSCCFDAFGDLFTRLDSGVPASEGANDVASFLRFEHDTHHGINDNAARLCAMVRDKLSRRIGAEHDTDLLLIAHSRGGLVARLASDNLVDHGLWNEDRLEVFTYGSPHRGTPFFESEVTLVVDHLIRFEGMIRFGLLRFAHRASRNGLAREFLRHMRAWRRRGLLMGRISGPSVLSRRQMLLNFVLGRAAATRSQGPRILRWPPGIEDVRESSEFIRNLSPLPRCPRFWTFGSTYDVRANRQRLDVFSKHILKMVQRAFVLASTSGTRRSTARPTERNDLVVSVESATAVGIACRINESLWHCGYFSAAPGATLARYLQDKILARGAHESSDGPAFDKAAALAAASLSAPQPRPHYVDPVFVAKPRPAPDEPASTEAARQSATQTALRVDPDIAVTQPVARTSRSR